MVKNYLTFDVEDYFQVSAFDDVVRRDEWDNFQSRVEKNTETFLDLLDAHNVKATFFVLGWVAEKYPQLIKKIDNSGHEVACHSFYHRLVYTQTPDEFRDETKRTRELLENITGKAVIGYRAPSYSITKNSLWAIDILEELGFQYDSSIFPIHHDRYGVPDAPRFQYSFPHKKIIEIPISTYPFLGKNIPVSGGGYFRLFPFFLTEFFLKSINKKENKPFIFYLHPWELDPAQPRIDNASALSRFRHYVNLDKTADRLEKLLGNFNFTTIRDSLDGCIK